MELVFYILRLGTLYQRGFCLTSRACLLWVAKPLRGQAPEPQPRARLPVAPAGQVTCPSPPGSALPSLGWGGGRAVTPSPVPHFCNSQPCLSTEAVNNPTEAIEPSLVIPPVPAGPTSSCAQRGLCTSRSLPETPLGLPPVPPLSSETPPKRPGSQPRPLPGSSETRPRGATFDLTRLQLFCSTPQFSSQPPGPITPASPG